MIRIESSCALVSFEPASSPQIRAVVFFDTEPDTLSPKSSRLFLASFQSIEARVPVITKV